MSLSEDSYQHRPKGHEYNESEDNIRRSADIIGRLIPTSPERATIQ